MLSNQVLINVFIIRKKMDFCTINCTAVSAFLEENPMQIVRDTLAGVVYASNLLFGLPINGYVLWLIMGTKREKIALDFISLNQIVVEILLSLSGILYFLQRYLSLSFLKDLFRVLTVMFLIMRPLVQSYICLEQYLATVHPVLFLRWKPLRYKVACCCVSWLVVIVVSIVSISLSSRRVTFFMIAALYQFFLQLMAFCCCSVLRALKRPGPGERQTDQHRGNSVKKRAFKIILINLMYTTVFQLSTVVVTAIQGSISNHLFFIVFCINVCIFVITGFVPPLLYLYRTGKLYSQCHCL